MKKIFILFAFIFLASCWQNIEENTQNSMENIYKAPAKTTVWHVHLKVSSIETGLKFYHEILDFDIMQQWGGAAFLSAGGYHHHIGMNTWESMNGIRPPQNAVGLYHTAFLYPTRKDLAMIVKRLIDLGYPFGTGDHGVSEAIYLEDLDGNGVELYWDRPREEWPFDENGNLQMYTKAVDIEGLLKELEK